MKTIFFAVAMFFGAALLHAVETPLAPHIVLTAENDLPDATERERIIDELRALLAAEKVTDTPPSAIDIRIRCGADICFVVATITPVGREEPFRMTLSLPRGPDPFAPVARLIADRCRPEKERYPRSAGEIGRTLTDLPSDRREMQKRRVDLFKQNYIFMLQGFVGTVEGARLRLGTLRWATFQMAILDFSAGFSPFAGAHKSGIHLAFAFAPIGAKFAVDDTGRHELGFLLSLPAFGITSNDGSDRIEFFPLSVHYRHNHPSGVGIEVGIHLPLLYWGYGIYEGIPNIQIFAGFGF